MGVDEGYLADVRALLEVAASDDPLVGDLGDAVDTSWRPSWIRWLVLVVIVASIVALVLVRSWGSSDDDPAACFRMTVASEPASAVPVSCSEEHDYEVVATFDYPADEDAPYPDAAAFAAAADQPCRDGFAEYTGGSAESSLLELDHLVPSATQWIDEQDRTVSCIATDPRGPRVGSIEAG